LSLESGELSDLLTDFVDALEQEGPQAGLQCLAFAVWPCGQLRIPANPDTRSG